MKTIPVPVLEDAGHRSRIGAACAVAKAVQGDPSCLEIIAEPPRNLKLFTGLSEAAFAEHCIALDALHRSRLEPELRRQRIAYQRVSDTGPARTAIRLHTPLNDPVVLSSKGGSDHGDPVAAAAYCQHHGIKAAGISLQPRETVIEVLLACASMIEASYLVMGAYGHSRTCEEHFGGVTREMLHLAPLPLLIAA